ncbi:MAG: ATP-binding cassette domain-containing protein [Oscillospiraceae bacterium]|nr:ATP-binding cassette domain-containing protein [Oscillospiraceae bacterium]
MQPIISVSNLQKSFKKHRVLKGVDFAVEKGTIFALLGSNGAGKTTAVKILSTLSKGDGGTATICGYDVARQPDDVRRSISLTGQYAAVDESLTGRENLHLMGQLRRLVNCRQRASELLEAFRLTEDGDRRVATYSGGMRRRLDIAMSLMGDPPVVFLDEPTTGLDPQNRLAMWEMVKALAANGTTVFLTTQYLEEAEHLADQIAILHEGKIIAEGTPDELKTVLPHGGVQLDFHTNDDAQKACALLGGYRISADRDSDKTLNVATDGSAAEFADVLNRVNAADISLVGFAQQLPTLEDVFLTLIGEKAAETEEK